MNKILLNDSVNLAVNFYLKEPNLPLLIIGEEGSGKFYLARYVTQNLLNNLKNIDEFPYFKIVESSTASISIDQIRELQKYLTLKPALKSKINRVVIIKDAQKMTIEAQNALLKIIEEPPDYTAIILTAEAKHSLLETVVSRTLSINIIPPTLVQATEFFTKFDINTENITRNYNLSGGAMGLLTSLLDDNDEQPLFHQIIIAKQIFTELTFKSLTRTEEILKDKPQFALLLRALQKTARAALNISIAKNDLSQSKKWLQKLTLIENTKKYISNGTSNKLAVTNLLLNI